MRYQGKASVTSAAELAELTAAMQQATKKLNERLVL